MRLLITGGAGFIGSNFIRYWLKQHPTDFVVNLDLLTYAGNLESLRDVERIYGNRYRFERGDIADRLDVDRVLDVWTPEVIVNFAAESHNSWAILDPGRFFRTNVIGTQVLLDAARHHQISRFHQISTCEVYGDMALDDPGSFNEDSPYRPLTPYNASKAAADHAVRAYSHTFGLPVTISNCCNNYGPYQFPEKLIPLFAVRLMNDQPLPIYRSSANRREWLHVLDHCRAIELILRHGRIGETYNVGSGVEKSVEEITALMLAHFEKPDSLKQYVPDRPQHDRRYLLDSTKIRRELGWQPAIQFEDGLTATLAWYKTNHIWWEPLLSRQIPEDGWPAVEPDPHRT